MNLEGEKLNINRYTIDEVPLTIRIEILELLTKLMKYTNWSGAQITFDNIDDAKCEPIIDVKIYNHEDQS